MNVESSIGTSGEWLYTHQESQFLKEIELNGWKPELNTASKYGCGVYLSRRQWHPDASEALVCSVDVQSDEVMYEFPPAPGWEKDGSGNSYKHFGRYLQAEEVIVGNHPQAVRGSSPQNVKIRDHFLRQKIKAICIIEHDEDVIVVYDPSAISIIERRQFST